MYVSDPYTPTVNRYECTDCLERTVTDERLSSCPECDGEVKNVAVPRE